VICVRDRLTQLIFDVMYVYHTTNIQKRFESHYYTASEILFDVHLSLDKLDNEFEMSGKSLDD